VLPQPPYSPDLGPADFFLFPKLKSTLKGRWFQMTQRYYGKFTDRATRDPEKGTPRLFPEVTTVLGVMHQCRRGVLWRKSVAGMSEKIIKKNSSETFCTNHVLAAFRESYEVISWVHVHSSIIQISSTSSLNADCSVIPCSKIKLAIALATSSNSSQIQPPPKCSKVDWCAL
jgi:hypothetical protein